MVLDSNIWTLPVAPELANLEGAEEEEAELLADSQSWLGGGSEQEQEQDRRAGPRRRARQLTEEELPVNDYVSEGVPPWAALATVLASSATVKGAPAVLLGVPCACPWGGCACPVEEPRCHQVSAALSPTRG